MPHYVVRMTHPPDQCPTANSKTRQMMQQAGTEFPKLAEKLGIKFVAGPYVLAAEHDGIAVVEAERVEQVEEFVLQSGMVQWNSVRITTARPVQEAVEMLNTLPPPLY